MARTDSTVEFNVVRSNPNPNPWISMSYGLTLTLTLALTLTLTLTLISTLGSHLSSVVPSDAKCCCRCRLMSWAVWSVAHGRALDGSAEGGVHPAAYGGGASIDDSSGLCGLRTCVTVSRVSVRVRVGVRARVGVRVRARVGVRVRVGLG